MRQFVKLAAEIGPLVVFFVANARTDIFSATAAFMAATAVSLVVSRIVLQRWPIMPLVSGVFVLGMGALTLLLQDETFIKMKPTIVNTLFATILAAGMLAGRPLLRVVLEDAFQLSEQGWRIFTWRWVGFFIALAVLNEIVWRNFSTDVWINFKLFGVMPLTMIFMLAQVGLLQTHQLSAEPEKPAP